MAGNLWLDCINTNNFLGVVILSKNARAPTRATPQSAGYDLCSAYDYIVPPFGKELISTDIILCLPYGTYGRIAPRSSLAWERFISIGAGVIDSDYRGNVKIVVFNHSSEQFEIKTGTKIAQLICEKIMFPKIKILNEPNQTDRGDKGFGSSGNF